MAGNPSVEFYDDSGNTSLAFGHGTDRLSFSLFYTNTAVGALVGYYLSRHSTSQLRLIVSAVIGIVSFAAYYHMFDTLIGVSMINILLLVLAQFLAMAGVFSSLRILIKMGLH